MNEVMSQSRLYRKLVPSKAKLVTSAAISTLMALIVGVGGGLSVMLVKETAECMGYAHAMWVSGDFSGYPAFYRNKRI